MPKLVYKRARRCALIRQSDAQRLARVVKREGVVVKIFVDGVEITILPVSPDHQSKDIDCPDRIIL